MNNVNEDDSSKGLQSKAATARSRLAMRMSQIKTKSTVRTPLKSCHSLYNTLQSQPMTRTSDPTSSTSKSSTKTQRSPAGPTPSSTTKLFVRIDPASMVKEKLESKSVQKRSGSKPVRMPVSPTVVSSSLPVERKKSPSSIATATKGSSSTVEEALSPRHIELRSFIQSERLARRNEKEMKVLHHAHVNEMLTDECNASESDESRSVQCNESGFGALTSDHDNVLKEVSHNTTDETKYQGPPEMDDDDEPIYGIIRKKMMSPKIQLKAGLNQKKKESCESVPFKNEPSEFNSNRAQHFHRASSPKSSGTNSFFVKIEEDEPNINEETVPIITLGTFAESAWLDYGDERLNSVGKSRSLPFDLHVPESSKLDFFKVQVEKVPVKKGFSLGLVCDNDRVQTDADELSLTSFFVKRGEMKRLFLTWTPTAPGGVCEVVYLKLHRGRVRVTARGHAKVNGKKVPSATKKVRRNT